MTIVLFVVPALLAAALAFAVTPAVQWVAMRVGAIDHPGPRKIHSLPTPRLGGLSVIFAVSAVLSISSFAPQWTRSLDPWLLLAIGLGALPIFAVSILDDIRSQPAATKLAAHLIGACIAVAIDVRVGPDVHVLGNSVHIGWLAIPISIVWLAGITSAFNIIDGLDGLSSGLALISAVSLAAVSVVLHHYALAATAAVLAGGLVGFLPFNIHPAKIYLGDTGACTIGFFLGCLTLVGGSTTSSGLAIILPMLVVGIPILDTTVSMLRRLVRRFEGTGSGILTADRDHIHHRLLALGLDHRRAVLTLYGAATAVAIVGFVSVFVNHQNAAVLLATLVVAACVGIWKLGYDEFAVVRSGAMLRFYNAPVLKKDFFAVFVDLAMVVSALYCAIVLKYDDWGIVSSRHIAGNLIALLPATTVAVFALMRIYRRAWSRANIEDIMRVAVAVVAATFVAYVIARLTFRRPAPATFFLTYTLVVLVFVVGSRLSYRVLFHWNRKSNAYGDVVVIYGAGVSGTVALREMLLNNDLPMKPIGFIDDDPSKRGRVINGYPVFGDLESLPDVVRSHHAVGVVVASEKIPITNVRRAKQLSEQNGAWIRSFRVDFRMVTTDYRLPIKREVPARPVA